MQFKARASQGEMEHSNFRAVGGFSDHFGVIFYQSAGQVLDYYVVVDQAQEQRQEKTRSEVIKVM